MKATHDNKSSAILESYLYMVLMAIMASFLMGCASSGDVSLSSQNRAKIKTIDLITIHNSEPSRHPVTVMTSPDGPQVMLDEFWGRNFTLNEYRIMQTITLQTLKSLIQTRFSGSEELSVQMQSHLENLDNPSSRIHIDKNSKYILHSTLYYMAQHNKFYCGLRVLIYDREDDRKDIEILYIKHYFSPHWEMNQFENGKGQFDKLVTDFLFESLTKAWQNIE